MKLQEILDTLRQIVTKLDTISICEMAEKQGFDKEFTYYTLDNEYRTHYPHVHICVKTTSKWDGKQLRNGSPYKTIGSIKLNRIKDYNINNIEFEEIKDNKITQNKYKKIFCDWLNSNNTGKRHNIYTNAYRCLDSYLMNNDGYFNAECEQLLENYNENN